MTARTPNLSNGATVGVVAASSALDDLTAVHQGLDLLKAWGLTIPSTGIQPRRWGYLAGTDRERLADLQPDPRPALLACARGGWGAARLLEHPLDWQPGWLLGFSDVTALLMARQAAGFDGGVHGPLLSTLAAEPAWSQRRLRQLLFGEELQDLQGSSWAGGVAEGPLIAANLTVASHLLGSDHMPDLRGAILILEDVGERPYRLDRMLTHWRLTGTLQNLAGLGFGRFSNCDDNPCDDDNTDDNNSGNTTIDGQVTAMTVLRERSRDLGIPVVADLPVGHGSEGNAALPIGRPARLDGDQGRLRML